MAAIVWKGYIAFGLVSFPVRLHTAGRPESVHFHMLHRKDLSRVKEVWYCATEDKPIERSEIVKGYETAKGEYVTVEDDELDAIAPETASTMEILQFVKEAEVDPIYFEHSYYVAPGDEITKPYALFLKALEQTGYSALARVAMHGREHVVLIRHTENGLLLHTLFYEDELHESHRENIPGKASATKGEIDLAVRLIRQLAAPFAPEKFHDTYRERVNELVTKKAKGETITKHLKPKSAPVIYLMEALKKSLASKSPAKRPRKQHAA